MGVDKALMRLERQGGAAEETMAERTAHLLEAVTAPAVEVGPGHSHLPPVPDGSPGAGPLAAITSGVEALGQLGWDGPVLVLATDLPHLSASFLAWLAEYPSPRSVMPTAGGQPQSLCARYSPDDLATAQRLRRSGASSMRDLLRAIDPVMLGPEEWLPVAQDPHTLTDIDDPADLERFGWAAQ
jgi:molybdopterin-guanine dinucleotide biosynthesis protein A